jgi:hypothetical protein
LGAVFAAGEKLRGWPATASLEVFFENFEITGKKSPASAGLFS